MLCDADERDSFAEAGMTVHIAMVIPARMKAIRMRSAALEQARKILQLKYVTRAEFRI
jgi:hypothetical protein